MIHGGPFDPFAVKGGFPVGVDGRVHTTFTHNPSTLRLSSTDPNLQNLPRGNDSEVQKWVKEMFVCPDGYQFWARDYAAIEAKLVGYFSGSRSFYRLADLGVHAFLASHILKRPVDLSWSDADIKAAFKELKEANKAVYDIAKRVVYLSLYMGTPRKMHFEYPEDFPTVKIAAGYQDLFMDICPEIRAWHKDLCFRVDGTKRRKSEGDDPTPWDLGNCFVRNPFGYLHRFYNVLNWEKTILEDGSFRWDWSYGDDAKRLVSNLPQSTAAAIIKQAAMEMWYNEPILGESLRLLIHDETLGESAEQQLEYCLAKSKEIMERPVKQLPLDPSWGLGEYVVIKTEGKYGPCWATMKGCA